MSNYTQRLAVFKAKYEIDDKTSPDLDTAVMLVLREGGRITPYRLGRMVGKNALIAVCPYREGSQAAALYALGVEDGQWYNEGS